MHTHTYMIKGYRKVVVNANGDWSGPVIIDYAINGEESEHTVEVPGELLIANITANYDEGAWYFAPDEKPIPEDAVNRIKYWGYIPKHPKEDYDNAWIDSMLKDQFGV